MGSKLMPRVSVVIPTFNEAEFIYDCLVSVFSQDLREPYEVIIADGPSSDATVDIATGFPVRVVKANQRGIGIAWKLGVLSSEADVLAFTEADCVVPPAWLSAMLSCLESDPGCIGVVGSIVFKGASPMGRQLARMGCVAVDGLHKAWKGTVAFRGKNFAIRKSALNACGGFDEKVQAYGDVELSLRAMHYGRIRYLPSLAVETSTRQFRTIRDCLVFIRRFITAIYLVEVVRRPEAIHIDRLSPDRSHRGKGSS